MYIYIYIYQNNRKKDRRDAKGIAIQKYPLFKYLLQNFNSLKLIINFISSKCLLLKFSFLNKSINTNHTYTHTHIQAFLRNAVGPKRNMGLTKNG